MTFPGPDGNYDRLRTPTDTDRAISPAVEARLNRRQKKIMVQAQTKGAVTSGWCRKTFDVTYDTALRDLSTLVEMGLLARVGSGRTTRYELKVRTA